MRVVAFACVVTFAKAFSNSAEDEAVLSLLQHKVRPIHEVAEAVNVDTPPEDAMDRIRARREARKKNPNRTLTPEQQAKRKARRAAKRQAHATAKAAGTRSFGDNENCDTCLGKCEELFLDVYKQCMIDGECRPWQKEDGPSATVCKKRCDRTANWQRAPCNRKCICDSDNLSLADANAATLSEVQWVGGRHRCRDAPIGQISDCTTVAKDRESMAYDSIHKCAKAAEEANADTFNFYRTSKEFGKCDLKNCGSEDLKLIVSPGEPDSPAGHGDWKVFSSYCSAPPIEDRNFAGDNLEE